MASMKKPDLPLDAVKPRHQAEARLQDPCTQADSSPTTTAGWTAPEVWTRQWNRLPAGLIGQQHDALKAPLALVT